MPQVSLYFDDKLSRKIAANAKKKKKSLSKYVSDILVCSIENEWSEDFLDSLGSLKGSQLERPEQPDLVLDIKREAL